MQLQLLKLFLQKGVYHDLKGSTVDNRVVHGCTVADQGQVSFDFVEAFLIS
jgi:hypothetical protein